MPRISSIWWRHNDAILKILWSNLSYPEKSDFQSISNAYLSSTNGKSSIIWSGKWYVLLCSDKNFSKYKGSEIYKKWKKCWVSKINVVSTWNISRSFHGNIANHTIFQISFSSSFHWCNLYTHLRYSENHFFSRYEGFDHRILKMASLWRHHMEDIFSTPSYFTSYMS